jgi:hypothetical protein
MVGALKGKRFEASFAWPSERTRKIDESGEDPVQNSENILLSRVLRILSVIAEFAHGASFEPVLRKRKKAKG